MPNFNPLDSLLFPRTKPTSSLLEQQAPSTGDIFGATSPAAWVAIVAPTWTEPGPDGVPLGQSPPFIQGIVCVAPLAYRQALYAALDAQGKDATLARQLCGDPKILPSEPLPSPGTTPGAPGAPQQAPAEGMSPTTIGLFVAGGLGLLGLGWLLAR